MSQFDQESVKGTDLSDNGELEDKDVLQDVEDEGAVKVADTAEEVTGDIDSRVKSAASDAATTSNSEEE